MLRSWITVFFLLCSGLLYGQRYVADISNLTVHHGLPDNSIYSFFQDEKGYMWMGSRTAISRFDGYSFKHFPIKPKDRETAPVVKIAGDLKGIWIGTQGAGLFYINTSTLDMTSFNQNEGSAYGNNIRDILITSDNDVWVVSENGVFRTKDDKTGDKYIPEFMTIIARDSVVSGITAIEEWANGQLVFASDEPSIYATQAATAGSKQSVVSCDKVITGINGQHLLVNPKTNRLWLSQWNNGLFVADQSGILANFKNNEGIKHSLSSDQVTGIAHDSQGNIWVGTNNRGINAIPKGTDVNQAKFINNNNAGWDTRYQKTADVFSRLSDYNIRSLFFDKTDLLWVGTENNGLLKVEFKKEVFRYFKQDTRQDNTLAHRDVSFPCVTKNGELWVGTWGGGLHYLSLEEQEKPNPQYKRYFPIEGDTTSLSFPRVFPVVEDEKGNLWLGTNGGGLNLLTYEERHKEKPKFKRFQHDPKNEGSLSHNTIRSSLIDKQQTLWVGTDRGLNRFEQVAGKFERSLADLVIRDITEGASGQLWLGTSNHGLVSWNPGDKGSTKYKKEMTVVPHEKLGHVLDVEVGWDGTVWIGCHTGLYSFSPDTKNTVHHTGTDVTAIRNVESIQIDTKKRLWVGTGGEGIFVYEPAIDRFTNFKMSQGSMGNSFTEGSSQGPDGTMYFGTRNGFYGFHPDSVIISSEIPKVYITSVNSGESSLAEDVISKLNDDQPVSVEFGYNHKIISISFSGMSYGLNDPMRFAYKMLQVDKNWNQTNVGEHRITYSNLQPGKYIFEIKALKQNDQGKSTKFSFVIAPPWWRTWWFYTLCTGIFVFSLIKYRQYRSARRKAEQQQFQDRMEREKEERLQQIKLEFFTNVSHEIKTPLTLIQAPVENILSSEGLSSENREYAALIKSNTERLIRLTNQLLDYRKVSLKQMPLKNEQVDVVQMIETVCGLFRELAVKNSINLSFKSNTSLLRVPIDKDKLESIVFNLVTNAFKYTPQKGKIGVLVNVLTDQNSIEIEVKDSGVGIPQDKIEGVFDLFYSDNTESNNVQKGTGLGLALVKELVTIMDGRISVESEEHVGTTFSLQFELPIETIELKPRKIDLHKVPEQELVSLKNGSELPEDSNLPLLLVVEDDQEMNAFITKQFSVQYRTRQAYDGQQGLKMAQDEIPDLIITDLMMPVMNGMEFCHQLKSDLSTSHIPVVMLTAKGSDQDKLEGIKTGADAYLTKPFSPDLLMVTVGKLIENRRLLQEKYSRSVKVEPSEINITPVDEQFIELVLQVIDRFLDDSSFTVEQMAKEVGTSSPQLYRKVKAITGMSPNEFIRNIRLKRGAQLLKRSGMTVSEISYKVGFGNPKYFSRCFSQQFGCSPKDFKVREEV